MFRLCLIFLKQKLKQTGVNVMILKNIFVKNIDDFYSPYICTAIYAEINDPNIGFRDNREYF
jgi:hypothetical protein